MPVGLTLDQLRALRAEYGSDERIIEAHPELEDTLRALEQASEQFARTGELLRSSVPVFPGPEPLESIELYEPDARQVALLAEIRDELAARPPEARPGGRPKGSYIETETFWAVLKMAVDGHASARAIERATRDETNGLQFVNEEKAGVVVKWAKAHRRAAKRALVSEKLPRGFSGTPLGVRLPPR